MVSAIILAGGESSRMGQDKSMLKWTNDLPLWLHIKSILTQAGCENIIVSGTQEKTFIPDIIPNKGAMSGIHSCLTHMDFISDDVIIVPCDMPKISLNLIKSLIEQGDNTSLYYDKSIFPLLIKNRPTMKDIINNYLKTSEKCTIKGFLKEINASKINYLNTGELDNLNTQEEFKTAFESTSLNTITHK